MVYLFVGILYWTLFGLGGLLGMGYHVLKAPLPSQWRWLIFSLSLLWGMGILAFQWYLRLGLYWLLLSLPLVGLTAQCFAGLCYLHDVYLMPSTWNQALRRQERHAQERLERQALQAASPLKPDLAALNLGRLIGNDADVLPRGLQRYGKHLCLEEDLLNQHVLLIGAPGSGKTEALKTLIAEILRKTQRAVYVVDGKAEVEFAQAIQTLFRQHRGLDMPLFTMGTLEKGQLYDGFQGDGEAIKQRLIAMFKVEQQTGDAEFYANVNRALLNLVCLSPEGVPRSLEALDRCLQLNWLRYAYRDQPHKLKAVERYIPWFDGFRVRADALLWDFAPYFSSQGFCLDANQGAIFSLRTAAMGDTTRRFFNFLIEDFKDWTGKRQHQPAVLVVDEFGQLPCSEIIALIELARSAQLGIILATQDLSAIPSQQVRERLLSSIQTKILMKTDTPELVGDMAGTRKIAHLTYQTDEVELTGKGSIRLEEERKVDLNAVRQFPPGRAFLIRSGLGLLLQFPAPLPPKQSPKYPPKPI